MHKATVGFIGYRGMVGSVLLERMHAESDFTDIQPVFFSTSQAGQAGPVMDGQATILADAYDQTALQALDAIVTCQGSDYTRRMHDDLRASGWQGYWIDAASELRTKDSSVLLLDPVNRAQIDQAIASGIKDLIGANCTVSTMLLGLSGLFQQDLVAWVNPDTYQAVSGAGANYVRELLQQMSQVGQAAADLLEDPAASLLDIDRRVSAELRSSDLPTEYFGYPIAANVLPWIDAAAHQGQSREEWKGTLETNKILATKQLIPVDGICVRVGSMRSHAQAVTMKLKHDLPLAEIEQLIGSAHEWVEVIPNEPQATLARLTPVAVSGTLQIAVGRLRKLQLEAGATHLTAFVVGDQLLWGAAEPLRRALNIVLGRL